MTTHLADTKRRRQDTNKLSIWHSVALAASLLFSTLPALGASDAPFVMSSDVSPSAYGSKWVDLIYTEAFKRLGIPLRLEYLTLKRRSAMADEGNIDGEVGRVYEYGAAHPNLIRVEESVINLSFSLYTTQPALHLQRLDELPATALLVEYRDGILMCENTLKQLLPPTRLSRVATEQQGLKKLLAGRTDLYCDLDLTIQTALHSQEFKEAGNIRKALDLGKSIPTYPYLHWKHAELAPRLAATLKQMKAEGLIETYRLQVERELGWTP